MPKGGSVTGAVFNQINNLVSLVAAIRFRNIRGAVEYCDLYQEGILSALKTLPKYDITKGGLNAYLRPRIHGAISDYIRKLDPASRSHRDKLKKVFADQETHAQKFNEEIPLNNLADLCDVSYLFWRTLSLNDDFITDMPLESIIPSDCADPFIDYADDKAWGQVSIAIATLSDRQRIILLLHYQEMRLKDIGSLFGISESRVSQIKKAACKQIKALLGNDHGFERSGMEAV